MAQYDQADWASRLLGLLPSGWFSSTALSGGGTAYSLVYGLVAGEPFHIGQINYQGLQTRIKTATDTNLDLISADYFGTELPRFTGESDAAFRVRIIARLEAAAATLPSIQAAVNFFVTSISGSGYPFGLDTGGGVDTGGSLGNVPPPFITIFDLMTDPSLSATIGLIPSQFAVLVSGYLPGPGWYLGMDPTGYLGYSTYLINTNPTVGPPAFAGLAALISEMKAEGTIPIYATQEILIAL